MGKQTNQGNGTAALLGRRQLIAVSGALGALAAPAIVRAQTPADCVEDTLDRIKRTGLLNGATFHSATVEGRRMAAAMAMCRPIQVGAPPPSSLPSASQPSRR